MNNLRAVSTRVNGTIFLLWNDAALITFSYDLVPIALKYYSRTIGTKHLLAF